MELWNKVNLSTQPFTPDIIDCRYASKCKIPARDLWDQATTFYDLYVPFQPSSDSVSETDLYSVPVMILNNPQNKDRKTNKVSVLISLRDPGQIN